MRICEVQIGDTALEGMNLTVGQVRDNGADIAVGMRIVVAAGGRSEQDNRLKSRNRSRSGLHLARRLYTAAAMNPKSTTPDSPVMDANTRAAAFAGVMSPNPTVVRLMVQKYRLSAQLRPRT